MKHSYILLSYITLLSTTQYIRCYVDQDFDAKLNILQQSINTIIAQSDLDPEVAQDITDKINDVNQYAQENIQQDSKEIRVAAGLTSILETTDKMTSSMNMVNYHDILKEFKYSARANTIHKLLIGAYPGKFKDEPYYTDPYTESAGFTLNDYCFNKLFTALINIVAPTTLGTRLSLNSDSLAKAWGLRLAAGVAAHYAWLLEKKLIFLQQQKHSN
jgi:hypothetical protein